MTDAGAQAARFDTVVIGAGQAGPFLAAKLVARGERVALIESRALGGTCINRGCTPTKTLRKSARVAYLARRAAEFGVLTGPVQVDFARAMARMRERVTQSRAGLERWLGGLDGLTLIKARARVAGRHGEQFVVEAEGARLHARRLVLNTGTRPTAPPIAGLNDVPWLDSDALLALDALPPRLVIIGGSYIGLEMAQIFRRLGSDVAVLEAGPRLTAREDADVSAALEALLRDEGIAITTAARIARVERGAAGGVTVALEDGARFSGTHLLVATGRRPNTDDLGLETIGLAPNARGVIETNGRLETGVPNVYALGDINGRGAFTHTSYHDHEILADNLAGADRSADARAPIYAMFTDPPLAHVGLYEAEARQRVAQGARISQAVFAMKDVSRAKEESETAGLIKLLVDETSGRFVGATMLGINADEIVQAVSLVMASGGRWQDVRHALPIHPTVTEFLPTILDKRKPLEAA